MGHFVTSILEVKGKWVILLPLYWKLKANSDPMGHFVTSILEVKGKFRHYLFKGMGDYNHQYYIWYFFQKN